MSVTQESPGARKPGARINARNLIVWVSVGILVGTEVFGALLATAWALGGVLELPSEFQMVLYGLALLASVAVMVPFMRRAARMDPLFEAPSETAQ